MRLFARVPRLMAPLIVAVTVVALASPVAATAPAVSQGAAGGTIRIAAEQEPDCADWIASCAGLAWGNWALGNLTLPQVLVVSPDGEYVPGAALADFPTLELGPPMRVTYRIHPEAVWSDGTPITSADFEYTWRQIAEGKGIYDSTGYVDIESIDTTDPKVAVVTFAEPYAAWRDLFGGFYYLLPSHLLDGKNRAKAMKDGYAFSGGPWQLAGGKRGWRKGRSITLEPNDAFWGTVPSIERVVFQFVPESAAQLDAVKTGQVVAAYPLPIDGAREQLDEDPDLVTTVSYGNEPQAFWINADRFPLDSQPVRQALVASTDRDAIVAQVLEPAVGEGKTLQSFIMPTFKRFFTPSFERYTRDLDLVNTLMTGDGWARNDDGIWEKNGRTARFTVSTTADNPTRELAEEIWQSQLGEAGFDVRIRNYAPDAFFGRVLEGRFGVGIYSLPGTPDPGLCIIFCSEAIPTDDNDFSGQNYTRTNSPAVDAAWQAVDSTIDETARIAAVKAGQDALAEYVASIPMYQVPALFVYDGSRIGGNVVDNPVMGPFFTLNEWTLR